MGVGHSSKEKWKTSFLLRLHGALGVKLGFSQDQVKQLHKRFLAMSGNQATIRQESFDEIPDLDLNPIRSKIIRAFFDNRNLHKGSSGLSEEINFEEFLTIIAYFKPITSTMNEEEVELNRMEKMRFLFHMYDEDFDGLISWREYQNVVEDLLWGSPQVKKEWVSSIGRAITQEAMKEASQVSSQSQDRNLQYQGLTFEDFLKTWQGIDVEVKMQVSFFNLEAFAFCQ